MDLKNPDNKNRADILPVQPEGFDHDPVCKIKYECYTNKKKRIMDDIPFPEKDLVNVINGN
jgi:hypothetical protein